MDIYQNLHRILINHSNRYPKWAMDDLYKLIHQAAMGSGHALQNKGEIRKRLQSELNNLTPGMAEPLVDIISPDNQMARIHLRPFLAAGLESDRLLDAFMKTAGYYNGSNEMLIMYGQYAAKMAANETFPFTNKDVVHFFQLMEKKHYPAIHHSATYNAEYLPAYRVIKVQYLPKGWLGH